MSEGQTSNPPSLGRLLLITLGAGAVATLLTLTIVLPAEFGRDPTGVGAMLGLKDLGGAAHATGPNARFYEIAYRTDTFEIPVSAKAEKGSALEFKVMMKEGETLIYSWEAEGAGAEDFYFDLHAETPGEDPRVVGLKQANAQRSDGALVAPIDGVHGWYWQNKSANAVKVKLKIAGFYALIAPGEIGNKAGIVPVSDPARAASAE
jgi:hypothetical protein